MDALEAALITLAWRDMDYESRVKALERGFTSIYAAEAQNSIWPQVENTKRKILAGYQILDTKRQSRLRSKPSRAKARGNKAHKSKT